MLHVTIGIDTESDNQWSTESRLAPTYENIHALPVLDDLFQKCGTRPTYLVTYPVVTDARSAERSDEHQRLSKTDLSSPRARS